MRLEKLSIPSRYCGPSSSGNGGYVCGRIARHIVGPASVRLLAPPPLEMPLRIDESNGVVSLRSPTVLFAEGRSASLDLTPPEAPSASDAEAASRGCLGFTDHSFPRCFVCGPLREEGDGLRIFPGPVGETAVVAAPWTVDASLSENGRVPDEFVWAALDCPSAFALMPVPKGRIIVLGELTARLDGHVHPGERCTVVGWPIETEGRKQVSGSAVYSEGGELVGVARATWIELPEGAFPAERDRRR